MNLCPIAYISTRVNGLCSPGLKIEEAPKADTGRHPTCFIAADICERKSESISAVTDICLCVSQLFSYTSFWDKFRVLRFTLVSEEAWRLGGALQTDTFNQ